MRSRNTPCRSHAASPDARTRGAGLDRWLARTGDRFWIIDAGQVTLDASVPGQGRVIVDRLGRSDVIGLSWMLPPHQWRFGAVATQPTQAFEFDAPAVRAACDSDPVLGYELSRRFSAVIVRRLQATRARLIDACARPAAPDQVHDLR
jgi:CRP/FNR family transcriptional regulator, cyclic AMP receptor protein